MPRLANDTGVFRLEMMRAVVGGGGSSHSHANHPGIPPHQIIGIHTQACVNASDAAGYNAQICTPVLCVLRVAQLTHPRHRR